MKRILSIIVCSFLLFLALPNALAAMDEDNSLDPSTESPEEQMEVLESPEAPEEELNSEQFDLDAGELFLNASDFWDELDVLKQKVYSLEQKINSASAKSEEDNTIKNLETKVKVLAVISTACCLICLISALQPLLKKKTVEPQPLCRPEPKPNIRTISEKEMRTERKEYDGDALDDWIESMRRAPKPQSVEFSQFSDLKPHTAISESSHENASCIDSHASDVPRHIVNIEDEAIRYWQGASSIAWTYYRFAGSVQNAAEIQQKFKYAPETALAEYALEKTDEEILADFIYCEGKLFPAGNVERVRKIWAKADRICMQIVFQPLYQESEVLVSRFDSLGDAVPKKIEPAAVQPLGFGKVNIVKRGKLFF